MFAYPTSVPTNEITYLAGLIMKKESAPSMKDIAQAGWAVQGYLQSKVLGQSALAEPNVSGSVDENIIHSSFMQMIPADPNKPQAQGIIQSIGTKLLLSFVQQMLTKLFQGGNFQDILKQVMDMITGQLSAVK